MGMTAGGPGMGGGPGGGVPGGPPTMGAPGGAGNPNAININVPPSVGSIRLNESLEAIKAEFEAMATEIELTKNQKDEVEVKLGAQVSELNHIRRALYDLEAQHTKVRQQYEDELARLRAELAAATRHGPPPHPSTQGIAGLASSSSSGFAGAVGGPGVPGGSVDLGPNGAPPHPPPYGEPNGRLRELPPSAMDQRGALLKDREREPVPLGRERDRERELRERERERDRDMVVDRDGRDRGRPGDRRDFELDREREREREMDRLADSRDPKRVKKDNGGPSTYTGGSHTTTPRLPPPMYPGGPGGSPYTAAGGPPPPPGPGGPGPAPLGHPANGSNQLPPVGGGPPGSASGLPPSSSSQALTKSEAGALGLGPPPSLTGGSASAAGGPSASSSSTQVALVPGAPPEEFNYNTVPPEYRKDGPDWFAAFNPKIKRTLDINLVHSFQHSSVVCCVQFSQDGRYLATGCNQTAQIFDTKSGMKVCELAHESEAHTGDLYIRSVRFSPDGKFLATGAEDRQIRIWDISRKCIRHVFDGHQQEIYSLDFSQDGRLIVSGSGDRTTRIWNMHDHSVKVFTITDVIDPNADAGVTSVAISPSTALVAAGSLDNIIRIWDVQTGQLLERLRGHTNSVYSVAFTPDGKGLVTGSLDKTLKLWDVSHLNSPEGRRKAAADPDMRDRVERERMERMEREGKVVQSANCVMDFIGHKDYVLSVSMSSDSRWVVSGSKDRCVHVWDSTTATLQLTLQGHKNSVISLDLNSNNDLLATGSGDSFARIWSLTRG
ncbi:TUPA [Coprinopsis cinerea okayama7|uniref:TUPA n=1 Tax=Coprinopsis cinerea (strain Okayama-7 / 130 / ATCC MYA-4618 / FGSC 9003) TaxID=240176 RepID=A8ND24_COPC7|nr:TUPA [Coprinopsis cinerea okayama7\|eukprot:XP_001832682.2 TUPA [Coprinopsis cinerea okayama7\